MNLLIADGGSTKCGWVVADTCNGSALHRFTTEGINPFIRTREEISALLHDRLSPVAAQYALGRICFYGAGAAFDKIDLLRTELERATGCKEVEVYSDMEGAARATAGYGRGIVCILGTGSNSCLFEGGRIVQSVPALGYVLGDEGSGAVLGRTLVGDILKGVVPVGIRSAFAREYPDLTQAAILERTYRRPMPNRFLASFAPFLAAHLDDDYVYGLVLDCFTRFLRRNVAQYPDAPVWFVGSIAHFFARPLADALRRQLRELGGIVRSPMEGLIRFHSDGARYAAQGAATECRHEGETERPFRKITEEPSFYDALEQKSAGDILRCINREDSCVAEAVRRAMPQIETLATRLIERMKRGGRLFYMGAGTSGRLGVLDASEVPPTFGMPPTVVIGIIAGGDKALRTPVEGAEDDTEQGWRDLLAHDITPLDTVVGIAASGTTPYVVGAVAAARRFGCLTASVSSNPHSPLGETAEIAIETVVGPEVVTGSSRMKSGTAQKLVCNMITTTAMIALGRVRGNRMVNMQLSNKKLVDRGTRMIVDELGLPYDQAQRLLLLHGSVQKAIEAVRGE